MKLFRGYRQRQGNRTARGSRHHRRRHDEPVADGEGDGRLSKDDEGDLPDRAGTGQRRGARHRLRRHDPRRPRPRDHRRAHRRQSAVHERRRARVQDAVARRAEGERHAGVLGRAGAARGEGRRGDGEPVRRAPGRHRSDRHEPHPGDRRDLSQLSVPDRGARRQHAPLDPHHRGREDGRRHLHLSAEGHRSALQASADRHRPGELPEGLGKVSSGPV